MRLRKAVMRQLRELSVKGEWICEDHLVDRFIELQLKFETTTEAPEHYAAEGNRIKDEFGYSRIYKFTEHVARHQGRPAGGREDVGRN